MPILATADVHFSADPRNAYRFALFPWLRKALKKHDASELLILGDLTDVKDEHSAWLVNKITDELASLAQECMITIPTGNHDYVNADSPFFQFLRHVEGIRWIHRAGHHKHRDFGDALFLPHDRNWEKVWPPLLKKRYDYVFTHCTFEGATAGFGKELKGVPPALFKDQGTVISGDVHVPQTFGNITYVGAPYAINYGDNYDGRVLLLREDKAPYSIPVDLPQKRLIEISSIDALDVRGNELRMGDLVRVKCKLPGKDRERWGEIKNFILEWGEENGYIVDAVPDAEVRTRAKTPMKAPSPGGDHDLIEAYAKRQGLPPKTADRGIFLSEKSKA